MGVFVVLGLLGVFGSKTSRTQASRAGYELSVFYPSVTRPGLPVRWDYRIRHPGGFSGPIEVATTFDYLHVFDVNTLEPQPASETARGGLIVWEFDPPEGDTFSLSVDAVTEVGIHKPPGATTSVLVDGRPVVQVRFRTVVIP